MNEIQTTEWYQHLIEDCKDIITEAIFTSRWSLVEGYHQLGERIVTDGNYQKAAKGNLTSLSDLSKNINVGERNLYRAIQFYDKYPLLDQVPEGKNITWNKIITKYLPSARDQENEIDIETKQMMRSGDFKDVLKDVYDIDAIITDPPYPKEFIQCWSDLSLYAKEHLKEDGFLVAYSGKYYLSEVINRLSEHLTYVWTFCLYHTGKTRLLNFVNIMDGWKPILIFSKGMRKMRYSAYDVITSEQREKDKHKWQQSESSVKPLIEIFSRPGELIVDPFAGSGTFLKVAKEMKRNAIGAEIDTTKK